jgi:hypothetical protein
VAAGPAGLAGCSTTGETWIALIAFSASVKA